MALVDETGSIIDGISLFALLAKARLAMGGSSRIAIPSYFPSGVHHWLASLGAEVTRVPNSARSLQSAENDFSSDGRGGFFFGEMPTGFDACYGVGWFLTVLASASTPLSQFRADLPDFPMAYDLVTVHGPDKGGVLRELTEQFPQDEREPEGVRITLSSGTALVTPDSFEPMFHIYAEGKTTFNCEETVEEVIGLIHSIMAQTKP